MSGLLRVLSAAIFLIVAAPPGTTVPGQMGLLPARTAKLRSVLPTPSLRVASCDGFAPTRLVVSVGEQPLTRRRDLSLATLRALSEQARHRPNHAILGFYAGSIGFVPPEFEVLTEAPAGVSRGVPCPHLEVRSELVAIDRQVAIASDLRRSPCLLRAAIAHYERHAEIASRALHRFAADPPCQ